MAGSVIFDDRVWRKLIDRCVEMHDKIAKVGVQGEKASAKHDEEGELTNVQIAAIHEFNEPGDRPPGRPFIRPVYDDDPAKWQDKIRHAAINVIKGANPEGELRKLGEEYRKDEIDRMKAGIDPPLAESTINRRKQQNTAAKRERILKREAAGKGHGLDVTPLIDTGTLMGSISVDVTKRSG